MARKQKHNKGRNGMKKITTGKRPKLDVRSKGTLKAMRKKAVMGMGEMVGPVYEPNYFNNGGIKASDNHSADATIYSVQGSVTSPDRGGVGGLRVQIVDKNIAVDIPLAETATDDLGRYDVRFVVSVMRKGRKKLPDLQALAYAGKDLLAASEIRYNATVKEVLNVDLPAASAALPSEYETLTSTLVKHLKGQLKDLQESKERKEISYLSNKTGWDARAVAMAALADQFSERAKGKIEPAFFYALFRAGLPVNEDTIYHADTDTIVGIWKKAVEEGVIPKSPTRDISELIKNFQALGAQKLLSGPALVGVSSLKDMLSVSKLDTVKQKKFAQLYTQHRDDMPTLWNAVSKTLGKATADRLQVDGKIGFLTINNATLMQKVHQSAGKNGISDTAELAQLGFHRAEKWSALLTTNVPIPEEIPGETVDEMRANYADYLAAQVRLSYPTAAVAEMVKSKELLLLDPKGKPVKPAVTNSVHAFLTEQQGKFEIGVHPIEQYLKLNNIELVPETLAQVKNLQRVYQITQSDQAMAGLVKNGINSAAHVVRYQRSNFVQAFAEDLGGIEQAEFVYEKSVQVHNAVLNVALSFLTAQHGLGIGVHSPAQIIDPVPQAANAGDVIAYSKLEELFGEMDFCECQHCRSILSPAAYLVDLLQFIDVPPTEMGKENPQTVLLQRRPDIQHLPLTCENTNIALPYIDVVNETLEYFVANGVQRMSLNGYAGHDTNSQASVDLLASPQSYNDDIRDDAYMLLRGEKFPAPLPFHQPLETLRRYFKKFEVPLPLAMERLRKNNDLERGGNAYGWRDILMEEMGLSRAEYDLLTTSSAAPNVLWQIYGFPNGTSDTDIINGNAPANIPVLSNVKLFTRRLGISYDDAVAILKTRFVNPNTDLLPKLERLGVPFAALKALKDAAGTTGDAAFDALLPSGAAAPDPAEYGGDIKAWVKNNANFTRIMNLLTLVDPSGNGDACSFDNLEFRRAQPMTSTLDISTRLGALEFVRMLRFIRLWKKTGWTIEQTDAAICALYRTDLTPLVASHVDTVAKLDAGFLTLLPRLGILQRVMNALNLTAKRDLLPLLACWSDIDTTGQNALYRQMFINPLVAKQDSAFADDGYGNFLDGSEKLFNHAETLRSAFNLAADEYDRIVAKLQFDSSTPLTLGNISNIFRRGWLARKLKISVRELLLLIDVTGLDPFTAPDATNPALLQLILLVQGMKDRSIKSEVALYLLWNQDLSGKSAPDSDQLMQLARCLRDDFAGIDDQFSVAQGGDDVAATRMALVYGQQTSDAFFALLDETLVLDVAYTHAAPALESTITAVGPKIAYDNFRHRLSHTGLMSSGTRDALKAVGGVTNAFRSAVDALFNHGEEIKGLFFTRFPELKVPYNTASAVTLAQRHSAFLTVFQPELSRKRKRQQATQRLSTSAALNLELTRALLDPPAAPYPLHAANATNQPALDDIMALATPGLTANIYFRDTATGAVDLLVTNAANLDYRTTGSNPLPPNTTTVGDPISGVWQGRVEAPEAGFYNIAIEADANANVRLELDGRVRSLTRNGNVWRNTDPIELTAGVLYGFMLTVEEVKDVLSVQWETPKRPRQVIPPRYLYPDTILVPFTHAYVRFLKAASLTASLKLTAAEIVHFSTHDDYKIALDYWLNTLPVTGNAANPATLLKPFQALLDYARIKAEVALDDERLLTVLKDPTAASVGTDGLLFSLTLWDKTSLTALLTHFNSSVANLSHWESFVRVYDAFALVRTMGISGSALIAVISNEPTGNSVRDFQSALRARYAAADWRDVVKPINDEMRGLQRDALVAYILHQMRSRPVTAHIDTADKLFEYFLMDVEMEPCMQTSRIRHALSTAQLFIERCLMNLEPRVSPASINARQWEWMKRYRVWEANRKVFLFPENWLEPELRDDKSPFFKEAESELLQSDITEDSASTVLLNYLSKLEEVAKLEPAGMFHVDGDPSKRTADIEHVIARTAGAHRKYYYRRFEFGYWTAWELIKLDIEDNPVMPVVWNGRLLLFWLRLLKQAPLDVQRPGTAGQNLTTLSTSDIRTDTTNVTIQAVLCWSEYYNGKWQPPKTSDINRPADLGSFPLTGGSAFDRSNLQLAITRPKTKKGKKKAHKKPSAPRDAIRLMVNYAGDSLAWFQLYNTNSLPTIGYSATASKDDRVLDTSTRFLTITYDGSTTDLTRSVLTNSIQDDTVEPLHPVARPFDAPFFYVDNRHTFFVTTAEEQKWVSDHIGYGIPLKPDKILNIKIPPLIYKAEDPKIFHKPWGVGGPIGPDPVPEVVDVTSAVKIPSLVKQFVTEDAYIHRAIGNTSGVPYGDQMVYPSGTYSPAAIGK